MELEEAIKDLKRLISGEFNDIILKDEYGYTMWVESIETVLSALEKKDKIIDEMAEYIAKPHRIIVMNGRKPKKEIVKEYFMKEDK